ncbi:MBA1-like protein-domain-containing protein [Limtongia smithiae]|uniref:MBA1-like protein-domain-containing protein n=1 Tax=Limtongia smithiae TaxID=1125753 RepID=UPI0034CFB9B4
MQAVNTLNRSLRGTAMRAGQLLLIRPATSALAVRPSSLFREALLPRHSTNFTRGYATSQPSLPIQSLGVAAYEYVPPTGANLPPLTKYPKLYIKEIGRRIKWRLQMGLRVILLRVRYKRKARWNEWREEATSTYVELNEAFARRNTTEVSRLSTMFVSAHLEGRIKNMDKDWELSWELEKFLEPVKLISVSPVDMGNDSAVTYLQLVYRFYSQQKLELTYAKNRKVPKKTDERKVLDYIVFVMNMDTGEIRVSGSLFECPVTEPIPTQVMSEGLILNSMKKHGDIFRKKPAPTDFSAV